MATKVLNLLTAPSWESTDSRAVFHETPTRKRKAAFEDTELIEDREPQATIVARGSPGEQVDDVDLSASDTLDDGDLEVDQDGPNGSSTCSSSRSEDWNFNAVELEQKNRPSLELSTPAALEPLNMSISPTKSGDFVPMHLPGHCLVASQASMYGFTPLVVSVGTTYFQRLASVDPKLRKAAEGCPDFAPFVAAIPELEASQKKSVGWPLHHGQGDRRWLLAVHLACIYIAAKNVEVVPYKHLLRTMLERLHGVPISVKQAERLELEVLMGLEWRLGPYFLHRTESASL